MHEGFARDPAGRGAAVMAAVLFLVGNTAWAAAQGPGPDPYRAAELNGHRTTGPMALAPTLDSAAVDGLGAPMCWVQSPHFTVGCALADAPIPNDSGDRRWLRGRLRSLDRTLRTVRPMTAKLDSWVQAHLFVDGLEAQLAAFEELAGRQPSSIGRDQPTPRVPGASVLGRQHRLVVLVFESEAGLERFRLRLDEGDEARRGDGWLHADRSGVLLFACSAERAGGERVASVALHAHVAHHATELMLRGCWRQSPIVPEWLRWGLGAHFARAIDPRYAELPEGARRRQRRPDWLDLVRLRLEHRVLPSADVMFGWCNERVRTEADAACAWSRVEFLIAIEPAGFRRYLMQWKRQPLHWEEPTPARMAHWNNRCFGRAWGWDFDAFERRWADYAWRQGAPR